MRCKYDHYYYWKNLMEQKGHDNPFARDKITENSVFLNGVIVNCFKGSYNRWLHFPDIRALIGFLSYVFIPTAFFMFLSEEDEDVMINSDLDELLNIMQESDKCQEKELIPLMKEFSIRLKELWNYEYNECFNALKNFSASYNKQWNQTLEEFSYFEVFNSPRELGKYVVELYEKSEDVDISRLEEQLGVAKEEWLSICDKVYENDFMNRKFTELLNNRIGDML